MIHWSRFPAFRHVKSELKKPNLTISDRDRGAVFMRWKERFLVPDHRVQDITGASFAGTEVLLYQLRTTTWSAQQGTTVSNTAIRVFYLGFYYVCVDFNPQPSTPTPTRPVAQSVPLEKEGTNESSFPHSLSPGKTEVIPPSRKRRDSSVRRGRGPSIGPRSHPPAATMSGFYFHQNSEPYVYVACEFMPQTYTLPDINSCLLVTFPNALAPALSFVEKLGGGALYSKKQYSQTIGLLNSSVARFCRFNFSYPS